MKKIMIASFFLSILLCFTILCVGCGSDQIVDLKTILSKADESSEMSADDVAFGYAPMEEFENEYAQVTNCVKSPISISGFIVFKQDYAKMEMSMECDNIEADQISEYTYRLIDCETEQFAQKITAGKQYLFITDVGFTFEESLIDLSQRLAQAGATASVTFWGDDQELFTIYYES